MGKEYQSIDFDIKLNDYRKSLILVKNLNDLNDDFNNDVSADSEYDGSLGTHSNDDNCKFCNFYSIIETNYSKIEINNQFINAIVKPSSSTQQQQQQSKTVVYVRYKTLNYPEQLLELSEYQPWRSVFALICYAVCTTQSELLNAIKRFNGFKQTYKKTIVEAKLFIVLSKNGSEFFRKIPSFIHNSVPSTGLQKSVSMISKKTIDEDTVSIDNTDSISIDFNNNATDSGTFLSSDMSTVEVEQTVQNFDVDVDDTDILKKTELLKFQLSSSNLLVEQAVNEETEKPELNIELNNELKNLENNIIYLEDANQILPVDLVKIKTVMHEIVNQIYIKIYKQADLVNSNDDKQVNYYSEYLKLPNERSKLDSGDGNAAPSLLQLKLINKKKTAGRMNKYRADLWLLLNSIENSVIYYFKAYSALKKSKIKCGQCQHFLAYV